MVKTKFKKAVSLVLAAVMSLTAFMGIGATTAFAAVGEKADVYLVDYPRSGDTNNNGEWGHGNLNYMNGWKGLSTKYTGLRAMGSYSGNIAYCIEPGTGQRTGDTLTEKGENFFNNISPNGTISGDDIRLLIGRILQYGYRGGISTSWKSQNESDANCIAHAYATQILIWETIVGERDASFNHVSTGGYNAVLECVSSAHPLRSKILSYYNSMVTSVQNHTKVPSFCTRSSGSAKVNELEWNGSKYVATLTDTNGVLGNYNFSANIDGVSFSVSGNKLTVSMEKAPSKEFTITAAKKNGVRRGVVVWSDGIHQNGNGIQDVVTYAQEVSDPVSGFVKMKVSYGSCQIVKTSEDGKVDGIQFTISGNGVNQTVTTANGGKFQLDNLMPGVYTVTEQSIDKYVPQEVHRVTVVAGQVSKVNFNNVLKRGNLRVIKSSEDNLVEGVTFHLYGTSLSGIAVDEYAVTDKNGVASFDDVLISGTTPYTIEEVDTAIRYVVPANQTAPINWKEVTTRNFTNILKKFSVTVTKSDREEGTPQGDATLAGAVYGIYKGETLVDKYVTDKNGQFTTKEYICDDDWTIREITPSEGYLLDTAIHKVGAEPQLYTVEHNQTANDVTEQVMKGNIAIIKHTDDGETKIETPENGATFEIYLKSSGSFDSAEEDERDVIVCDENGFGQTKDMPYGVYTVHQTSGWEGRELMDDFDVFISQNGQTYRYLINNANFESYIKVVKVDAESGKSIPYAGAGFKIFDPDGNQVTMTFTYPTPTTIDIFYTDANGQLVTPEKLEYGKGYSLVEVQAPYGYVLDSTPVYFDVAEEHSSDEGGITVIKVDKPNMAQKGTVSIEKTGEVFSGVNISGEENADVIYQPVYEVKGLAGAIYEITAAEDIITPDGTVRFTKGEVVDTVTTDENGLAKSKELYLGRYTVVEITAPEGMVINKEAHEVELTYAGQEVAVTETATSFVNERQKVTVSLEKLDIPITLITEADCIPDHYSKDINGKIIAIDPKVLKPEFQRADRQLYYVTGGFGASANSRGSAVFCTNLHTGKSTRYERMDVMGEVKPECLPEWAKEKAQELLHKKAEFDDVINGLRDGDVLSGRKSMSSYCYSTPDSSFNDDRNHYGIRLDTEKYSYLMRFNPNRGEYNLYCYCYQKEWLNNHLKNAERGIRFIDPHYQEQFRIADGEKISVKLGDGKTMERTCRYIDDYHLEVGTNLYHICEFAELCERNGHTVEPAAKENTKSAKDKEKSR